MYRNFNMHNIQRYTIKDYMLPSPSTDIEQQLKNSQTKQLKQLLTYTKKQKTTSSFYSGTQKHQIKIKYHESQKTMSKDPRKNYYNQTKDTGGISFQYIHYNYEEESMPMSFQANVTGKEFVGYWGFFDVLALSEIFVYIRDKECFTFSFEKNNPCVRLKFEVQFNNKNYKREIKIDLNRMNLSSEDLCKLYIRYRQKINNFKMEAMMKKLIQLESYKNMKEKKEENEMFKSGVFPRNHSYSSSSLLNNSFKLQ